MTTTTVDVPMGDWGDSYQLRSGTSKVHLVAEEKPDIGLCGAKTKPWTKPADGSTVCARCAKKAHGEHRTIIAKQAKGRRPTPSQVPAF